MDYSQAFFLYVAGIKLCDALVVALVWHGCWYMRFDSHFFPIAKGIPNYGDYHAVLLPLTLVYMCLFHIVGAYRKDRVHFGFRAAKKLVEGSVLGLLVFIAVLYFAYNMDFSRLYLVLFLTALIPALFLERAILHFVWKWAERHVVRRLRVLLVGTGDLLSMYVSQLNEHRPYPVEWVGRLGDKSNDGGFENIPYLGDENRLQQTIGSQKVDFLVISYPTDRATKYEPILQEVSNELVGIKVLPDFGKYNTFTYSADHECGIPLLHFNKTPVGTTDRVFKRILDFTGSVLLLILFSPVFLIVSILIKLTSKGPIFYSQERVGADGTAFRIYKFRSMELDAEKQTGAVWAVKNDDRTTKLGKWLRRTSMDEIPQFYNVLRGDMSLVGPRPERPVFVDQFKKEIPKYMLRHKMKSGITGWAQVNGWRGNTSLDERIKHDLYYIENWSHLFDFKILVMTFVKGFVNRHAY